jgi:hypothetical protein
MNSPRAPTNPRELSDEALFYRLLAGLVGAFAVPELCAAEAPSARRLLAYGLAAVALLTAGGAVSSLDRLGGWRLRLGVTLSSLLGLGALVWLVGRTTGMHAALLIAVFATAFLHPSRPGAMATCGAVAACAHSLMVLSSGAWLPVQLQWIIIEGAALLVAWQLAAVRRVPADTLAALAPLRPYQTPRHLSLVSARLP